MPSWFLKVDKLLGSASLGSHPWAGIRSRGNIRSELAAARVKVRHGAERYFSTLPSQLSIVVVFFAKESSVICGGEEARSVYPAKRKIEIIALGNTATSRGNSKSSESHIAAFMVPHQRDRLRKTLAHDLPRPEVFEGLR